MTRAKPSFYSILALGGAVAAAGACRGEPPKLQVLAADYSEYVCLEEWVRENEWSDPGVYGPSTAADWDAYLAAKDHFWQQHLADLSPSVRRMYDEGTHPWQNASRWDESEAFARDLMARLVDVPWVVEVQPTPYPGNQAVLSVIVAPGTDWTAICRTIPIGHQGFMVFVGEGQLSAAAIAASALKPVSPARNGRP